MFNSTLNKTFPQTTIIMICFQNDIKLKLAHDLIDDFIRILIPFTIISVCNILLVVYVRRSRARVITTTLTNTQRGTVKLTRAVCATHLTFIVLNFSHFVLVIFVCLFNLTGMFVSLSIVERELVGSAYLVSILLSYSYTLLQFWFDFALNSLFRKRIYNAVLAFRSFFGF